MMDMVKERCSRKKAFLAMLPFSRDVTIPRLAIIPQHQVPCQLTAWR